MASYASVVAAGSAISSHRHVSPIQQPQARLIDERDSLQRQVVFLTSELSLKEQETLMYQRQMDSRQKRLDASSEALLQVQQRLDSANEVTTETLKMVDFYKARVKALMSSLLAAEEKNVELMKEVIRLGNMSDTGNRRNDDFCHDGIMLTVKGYLQNSTSATSLPTPSLAESTPSISQPMASSITASGTAGHDSFFDHGSKHLDDLKNVAIGASRASQASSVSSRQPNGSIHTPRHSKMNSSAGLNPESEVFTPRHQRAAAKMQVEQAPELFVKPVRKPVTITPPDGSTPKTPKAKNVRDRGYGLRAGGQGSSKEDETLAQNLHSTTKRLASHQNSPPEPGEVLYINDDNSPDANTRKWLDEQMCTARQPVPIDTSETTTRKLKPHQLIDFSSTDNSPSSPTKDTEPSLKGELAEELQGLLHQERSKFPTIQGLNAFTGSPMNKAVENSKPDLNLLPSPSPEPKKQMLTLSARVSSGSPTPRASSFSRATSIAMPNPVKSEATPAKKMLAPKTPNVKADMMEKMAAFSSKWSTPNRGRSRRTSQATSREQSTRPGSPVASIWGPEEFKGKTETMVIEQHDRNVVRKATPPAEKKDANKIYKANADEYAEERSIRDEKRQECTTTKRNLAHLFSRDRKEITKPTSIPKPPTSANGLPSPLLRYDDGSSAIQTFENGSTVDVDSRGSTGRPGKIKNPRGLGAVLDPMCKAMVLKEDAWKLKNAKNPHRDRYEALVAEDPLLLAEDVDGNWWLRVERERGGRLQTCYVLTQNTLKDQDLIHNALTRIYPGQDSHVTLMCKTVQEVTCCNWRGNYPRLRAELIRRREAAAMREDGEITP